MWAAFALLALVAAGGVAGLDTAVSRWLRTSDIDPGPGAQGTALLDLVPLKGISNFLLGAILLLAAGMLMVLRSTRAVGWPLLYLALVQSLSTVIADFAKPWFGRLRPHEVMADAGGADVWFQGANSFPSGHAAFYGGLFFPLVLLFPRLWPLWIAPPLFVAAARVLEQDHYMSDVAVSLALAALLAATLWRVREIGGE
jgi:membrane-associated phospholipid phosphatase